MPEKIDRETRSRMMAGIAAKNTKPELKVRKLLHARGYRYRLHDKRIPGKPDISLSRFQAVIQIHGCFWHRHECHLFKWPATNRKFWRDKLNANFARDQLQLAKRAESNIRTLTIWECSIKGSHAISDAKLIDLIQTWLIEGESDAQISGYAEVLDKTAGPAISEYQRK